MQDYHIVVEVIGLTLMLLCLFVLRDEIKLFRNHFKKNNGGMPKSINPAFNNYDIEFRLSAIGGTIIGFLMLIHRLF